MTPHLGADLFVFSYFRNTGSDNLAVRFVYDAIEKANIYPQPRFRACLQATIVIHNNAELVEADCQP